MALSQAQPTNTATRGGRLIYASISSLWKKIKHLGPQGVQSDGWGRTTLLNQSGVRPEPHKKSLDCAIWNINGLKNKREIIQELITEHDIDILFLSETKRLRAVDMNTDLAIDTSKYRVIQLFSTTQCRGGLVLILSRSLRLETAKILKVTEGDNFIQGIV